VREPRFRRIRRRGSLSSGACAVSHEHRRGTGAGRKKGLKDAAVWRTRWLPGAPRDTHVRTRDRRGCPGRTLIVPENDVILACARRPWPSLTVTAPRRHRPEAPNPVRTCRESAGRTIPAKTRAGTDVRYRAVRAAVGPGDVVGETSQRPTNAITFVRRSYAGKPERVARAAVSRRFHRSEFQATVYYGQWIPFEHHTCLSSYCVSKTKMIYIWRNRKTCQIKRRLDTIGYRNLTRVEIFYYISIVNLNKITNMYIIKQKSKQLLLLKKSHENETKLEFAYAIKSKQLGRRARL